MTASTEAIHMAGQIHKAALRHLRRPQAALQFKGLSLDDPSPDKVTLALALSYLVTHHRQWSLVHFGEGMALVRTVDLATMSTDFRAHNERAGTLSLGGTEEAASLGEQYAQGSDE